MSEVVSDEVTTVEPEAPEADETTTEPYDKERALAKITKANSEAKGLRARVKELEAYEAKVREFEESQKSESDKVKERAEKAEQRAQAAESELIRERIARRHKIDDEDLDLLGTGTEEQLEARAQRLAAKNAAAKPVEAGSPPSEKPVAKLRPGATGHDTPITPPQLYPAAWLPSGRPQN